MKNELLTLVLVAFFALILFSEEVLSVGILGPEIKIQDNNIVVKTGLVDFDELETAIKSGVEKEIIVTVELFRVWSFWPDEFVISKKVQKTIKYDSLRDRFLVSSFDGTSRTKKKFRSFDDMKMSAFMIKGIEIVNIRELEPGSYYLRVVAESRSRELPPVIGLLMLFIPEVEMSLAKESQPFTVGANR